MKINKAEAKAYAKEYVVITLLNISLKCTFKFFAIAGSREVEIRQTDRQTETDTDTDTDRQTETATGLPAFLNASSTACLSNYMHLSFYLPTSLPVCRFIYQPIYLFIQITSNHSSLKSLDEFSLTRPIVHNTQT